LVACFAWNNPTCKEVTVNADRTSREKQFVQFAEQTFLQCAVSAKAVVKAAVKLGIPFSAQVAAAKAQYNCACNWSQLCCKHK